jgi:hypothetical protein
MVRFVPLRIFALQLDFLSYLDTLFIRKRVWRLSNRTTNVFALAIGFRLVLFPSFSPL